MTSKHTPRGRRAARRGMAAAELALMTPVLGLLSLAIVDYARLFSAQTTLADCARNGALYQSYKANATGSPDPSCLWLTTFADYKAAALSDATNLTNPAPVVQPLTQGTDSAGNSYVQVTVTYSFKTLMTYPGIASPVPLSRTARLMATPN